MSKTIAIYFSDTEAMGYPFNKPQYFEIYRQIIAQVESHDIDVYVVRGPSYLKNGHFTKGWRFINGELVESVGEIHADLIFNRDDKNTIGVITDCSIINHPEFDELCVDKYKTFAAFPEMSPQTAIVPSFHDFVERVKAWSLPPHKLVVLKKNFESEGRGIFILPTCDVTPGLFADWSNVLVQEFIDGFIGIVGVCEGLHDLRITVINHKPMNSYLRQPKKGSYIANYARGGRCRSIDLDDVPTEVFKLVDEINHKMQKFWPIIYAADFANSPQGFRLIELNSRPGVQHPEWSATYKKFNDGIVRMLVEAVKDKKLS